MEPPLLVQYQALRSPPSRGRSTCYFPLCLSTSGWLGDPGTFFRVPPFCERDMTVRRTTHTCAHAARLADRFAALQALPYGHAGSARWRLAHVYRCSRCCPARCQPQSRSRAAGAQRQPLSTSRPPRTPIRAWSPFPSAPHTPSRAPRRDLALWRHAASGSYEVTVRGAASGDEAPFPRHTASAREGQCSARGPFPP